METKLFNSNMVNFESIMLTGFTTENFYAKDVEDYQDDYDYDEDFDWEDDEDEDEWDDEEIDEVSDYE